MGASNAEPFSRILIVEGTSGVGKSTLLDGMVRRYVADRPPRKLRTLLHLTQAHTYGPLAPAEDAGTLSVQENVQHLEHVVAMLEWYVRALTAESTIKFLALVDTLHVTHCHRPGLVGWEDVRAVDARLARIGARMVFLRASPETIWERSIASRANDQFILGYAQAKLGASLEQIHGYFVDEQERMRRLLELTCIPQLVLDAETDLETNLARAAEFWLR